MRVPEERPPHEPRGTEDDERPPLGGWNRLYALVIGALAIEIVLLALLTGSCR